MGKKELGSVRKEGSRGKIKKRKQTRRKGKGSVRVGIGCQKRRLLMQCEADFSLTINQRLSIKGKCGVKCGVFCSRVLL